MIDSAEACRRSTAYRVFRRLQWMICGIIVLVPTAIAIARPVAWLGVVIGGAVAAGVALLFGWRLRSLLRASAKVCEDLDAIARAAFDGTAQVAARDQGHLETLASRPMFQRAIARRSVRFVATGTWKGAPLEIGETVTASRDFNFTISHVRLGGAARGQLRMMTRGLAARMSRWHRDVHEVKTGDDAFDGGWVVDADEQLARRVLAPDTRRALVALHGELRSMQVASVEATESGVIVRWPAPMTPARAIALRDLAAAIDARLGA